MTRLQLIDQETRAELGEIGVDVRPLLVLCTDCRFRRCDGARTKHNRVVHYCAVNGNAWCSTLNPNGECTKFSPLDPTLVQRIHSAIARNPNRTSIVASVLLGASFGFVIATIVHAML